MKKHAISAEQREHLLDAIKGVIADAYDAAISERASDICWASLFGKDDPSKKDLKKRYAGLKKRFGGDDNPEFLAIVILQLLSEAIKAGDIEAEISDWKDDAEEPETFDATISLEPNDGFEGLTITCKDNVSTTRAVELNVKK